MNMHDLHLHIPRTDKEKWISWASKLDEGKSYFSSALSDVAPKGRLVEVLARSGADITDPNTIKQAYKDAEKRLRSGSKDTPEEHFSSDKKRKRQLGGAPPVSEDFEGAEARPSGRNEMNRFSPFSLGIHPFEVVP